jgi:hypothetical protein
VHLLMQAVSFVVHVACMHQMDLSLPRARWAGKGVLFPKLGIAVLVLLCTFCGSVLEPVLPLSRS